MVDKQQPPEHPQIAFDRAQQEAAAKAPKQTPPPHPAQQIAAALGTDPDKFDRDALAEFRAGHTKKAATVQAAASAPAESGSQSKV